MAINAGALNRRVTFLRHTEGSPDGMNHRPVSYPDLASRAARVSYTRDAERLASREVAATVDVRLLVRADPVTRTVTPKDRFRYGAKVFDIIGVKEVDGDGLEVSGCARAETTTP